MERFFSGSALFRIARFDEPNEFSYFFFHSSAIVAKRTAFVLSKTDETDVTNDI